MKTVAQQHDCLLLDLDGTLLCGSRPTEGAVDSLDRVQTHKLFITNNASRGADEVAAHLRELGFSATGGDVVTSGQSAARLLAEQLPAGSRVLIVGTESLADEIARAGLRPVRRFQDQPVAVVQGHSTATGWADLAEAALAIRAGALWVAANVDPALPSERGLVPGNGAMVAALRAATGAEPQVAGKPSPRLMHDAAARADCCAPLVVGDRLDTDIAGANAAKLPSLLVLTGVTTARDAVYARAAERPTYIAKDLRALHHSAELLAVTPQPAWRVDIGDDAVTVTADGADRPGDGLSIVRALASALWNLNADGRSCTIKAGDEYARAALRRWSLMDVDSRKNHHDHRP
ncbi:HAD-IIA family hydrolase [Mycobacterium botniense]|uniref:D,L-glycerol 3-phosphate phosphatase n=1 Tax=Mycobacterium botniense TaxID=84962 RepID=A0A7I9Y196_9MYCO|nr:HAD-IIA family hydrolase [Mycobacterium botniense]GFG75723.1 D,L-glycerol 3-phosphate phosphatase [Mycobacterium botniense]